MAVEGRKIGERVYCPYCRTWLKGHEYYCRNCGFDVRKITEKIVKSPDDRDEYCFIATAAYGTPLAKELDILRHWRDSYLRKFGLGRMFIKAYYCWSPPVARHIAHRPFLQTATRFFLKPMVMLLSYHEKHKKVREMR